MDAPNVALEVMLSDLKSKLRQASLQQWKNFVEIKKEFDSTFSTVEKIPTLSDKNKALIEEMRKGIEHLRDSLDKAITQFS